MYWELKCMSVATVTYFLRIKPKIWKFTNIYIYIYIYKLYWNGYINENIDI
jgi:hypothetical protein